MIKQPIGGFQGQASDFEIHAKNILQTKDRLNRIYSHHTGQPVEKVAQDTDRDNFMTAQEALEYGLIDQIMTSRN